MKNKESIKNGGEPTELIIDSHVVEISPLDEYRKGIRRRRGCSFLFLLLILAQSFVCLFLLGGISAENLHQRVTREYENSFSGENSFESGTYFGDTEFGYFDGDGVFKYVTGTVYTGQWSNNHIHGVGVLNVPSEGTYEGEFIRSQKSGNGTFTWDDGAVYKGEWKNDQMSGQGTYTSPDNVTYIGTFQENRFFEGSCEFENTTGSYVATYKAYEIDNLEVQFADGTLYIGDANEEAISGSGTMTFANGDKYSGNFENGSRSGKGIYTWASGDKYDGSWEDDSMNGSGSYTYADGSCAKGKFKDNEFIEGSYTVVNSFGEYTFTIEDQEPVAVKMVLASGTTYSGDMENGELTGTAQIVYSNGDKYSGRVDDGYKTGQGTYIWSSGASYEGDWAEDKMNGQGTYFYPETENGYKLSGTFENGVPHGQCWYYESSSESYKTDWTNGRCVKIYE